MPDWEKPQIKVLVVDEDPKISTLIKTLLCEQGLEVISTSDPFIALQMLETHRPRIAVLELILPHMDGMDLLERMVNMDPGLDVMILTSHYSTDTAVTAIQKGACDYLTKPLRVEQFLLKIGQLVEEIRKRQQTISLDRKLVDCFQFEGIVGRSPSMLEVFSQIRRVSPHFRTLLITGPTGTGKELAARAIHKLSPAANNRFVSYNCSAIVETLIESELFGHVKGAFTGATQDKVGGFDYADGGVLFLDEIGEMPLSTQTKLLRVLQEQELQKVGSPVTHRVDVRVVAATHRDLRTMVDEKKFREDLFYRLSMIEIQLPSLMDRREDLPLLQRHFLARFSRQYGKPIRGLTRRAQAVLSKYSWPGNIRELENVLGRACLMAEGEVIDFPDLSEWLRSPRPALDEEGGQLVTLEEAQRRYVATVMKAASGNKQKAAEILGISRATLYRLLASPQHCGSPTAKKKQSSQETASPVLS